MLSSEILDQLCAGIEGAANVRFYELYGMTHEEYIEKYPTPDSQVEDTWRQCVEGVILRMTGVQISYNSEPLGWVFEAWRFGVMTHKLRFQHDERQQGYDTFVSECRTDGSEKFIRSGQHPGQDRVFACTTPDTTRIFRRERKEDRHDD